MKLIIQSDDYGITDGVACGILHGIDEGMIDCTGLFSNMPASKKAAELIRNKDVCLGQDINIVAGFPCADPSKIPCMVKEDGSFYSSKEHRKIDAQVSSHDHLVYEECLIEVEAQIERFIELVGKKPEYLHGHSYGTETLGKAMHVLAEKYSIPITFDLYKKYNIQFWKKSWYSSPFLFEDQMKVKPLDIITEDSLAPIEAEYGLLGTHCGYVDADLFKYSSFTMTRAKDLEAITSAEFKDWLKKHNIQRISFRDLLK